MRNLMFGAVLALVAASPALAVDRVCKGEADGAKESSVEVDFTVDETGAVTKQSVDWSPPGGSVAATLLSGAPSLTITYGKATESSLGPATAVVSSALSMGGNPFKGAVLAIILDGDGSHEWSVEPLVGVGTDKNDKKTPELAFAVGILADVEGDKGPVNPDLLDAIEKAKTARLGFRSGSHVVGGATDADLSDHAARDALFHQAWDAAIKALANPKKCEKAQ
jgi:hypothetical protein